MLDKPSTTRGALKAGVATVVLSLSLFSAAHAQQVPAEAAPNATAQQGTAATTDAETIVVTGTLIRNPNLESTNPVQVVGAEEIELQAANVAEELLRELPGVVPSIGSAVNNGNGGASFVNLRGLGSNRNLVLIDGVRLVPAELEGRFDLNNVPVALVERVDILTGGASTTYGADAVSGVVNFITRKDFAGFEISASNSITERGDGNQFRVDATIGANFDDGRGNATLSLGYQEVDPVFQGDRNISLDTLETFSGTALGSGTSVPSRFTSTRPLAGSAPNTLSQFIDTGRTVPNPSFNPALPVGPTNQPTLPVLATQTGGAANGGVRQVNPATNQFGPTFQTFNFNPFNIFQTPFERFNMFGSANYEIVDGVEVYSRGLFSRNKVQTIIAPSGAFGTPVAVSLNSPFLTPTLRNQFCALNVAPTVVGQLADGTAASGQTTYVPLLTQAQCDAAAVATGRTDPNYREVSTSLSRRAVEAGPRTSLYTTTIFDFQTGVRGSITDNLDFDVFGTYGESENVETIGGYTLNSRFRQGLLLNRDAATGAVTCQDPANGCVPVNVFGPLGSISQEAVDFLTESSTVSVRTTQSQVRGTLSGDFGFTSPLASEAVAFAVGGEYRKYTASQVSDTLAQAGDLGGAGGADPNINGGFSVVEAVGELIVPLISDRPFFENLSIEGGVRYSSYKVDAPGDPSYNTTTWKAGANWEIGGGLKIRGNYSRASRAPNISELFDPQNTVLTNLGNDPCASVDGSGQPLAGRGTITGELRAICLAQGAPERSLGVIEQPSAGQVNTTTGGNPNILPEVSDSWTLGAIFQPSFVPGLTIAIDYYNIKVNGAITTPTPDDAIAACFGTGSTPPAGASASPACLLIGRNPFDGSLNGDPSNTRGLSQALSNAGRLFTDGIDLNVNFRTDLTDDIRLALNFSGNYTFRNKFNAFTFNPDSVNRECVNYYSANCGFTGSIQPEFTFSQRTTLSFGAFDLSLLWRHLSALVQEPRDRDPGLGSGPFFNGTIPANIPGVGGRTEDFGTIPSYDYFDLSARVNVNDRLSFTFLVENLLDEEAPLTGNNAGSTAFNSGNTFPSTYDALGRTYSVTARMKF